MKRFKKILLGLVIVLIVIQFVQPPKNRSAEILPTDLTKTINVPDSVQRILRISCYDCHSNNTNYPWYSTIQPIGWMLARHIKDGKADLNFSEFGSYSLRRKISKLNEIEKSITDKTMPLGSYTLLHNNARLSQEDKKLLSNWSIKMKDSFETNK